MLFRLTRKPAGKAFFREFFTSIGADPIDPEKMRTAAWVRLLLIVPTIFLITFVSLLDIRGAGYSPQAQDFVFFTWTSLCVLYIAVNIVLCLTPDSANFLLRHLTFLSIFIELATNQLVLYLAGVLISPQTLYIVMIIAVYRVFFDHRFGMFATLAGGILYTLTALLEIMNLIPLSPALPYLVDHPIYSDTFVAVNIIAGISIGIVITFFSINYGMNQALKLQRKLMDLSLLDGLTGIANRRRFEEYLDMEWKRAVRSTKPLSLIMIDIDAFKPYNDNYGHAAGDACLKRVAWTLQNGLKRSVDLAARFGGEEFAVILPETDSKGAYILAEELRSKIEALHIAHSHSPVQKHITVSMGVSTMVPKRDIPEKTILEMADKALYQAKKKGRNRVAIATR